MSNYTKSTNFATKDNLTPGDPLKVVRGTEIDTEYNNIATAIATKTDNASAAITGGTITGITDLAVADGGTGASTAATALNNLLPSQTSNANKYLQTDGTNATWDAVTLSTADITGTLAVANGGTGVTSSTGTGSVVLSNSPTLVTPALGTPASGVATNITGLPISTGVSGLGTGVATFLGTPSSANLISAVTDETGTGSLVFATSPTLVTPALGTPSALVGTNITGTASGLTAGNVTTNANLTGAITSVGNASSLGSFSSANLLGALTDETGTGSAVFATSPTLVTPILGTPTSATLTNATGLPIGTGVSGLGTGVATFLATPSSANLAAALTDETGSGANVFATSPTLVTPLLGTPTSGVATNLTGLPLTTGVTGILPTANGGTNLGGATPFTAAGVVYASGTSALATSSALTWDTNTLSILSPSNSPLNLSASSTSNTLIQLTNANASKDLISRFRQNGGSGNWWDLTMEGSSNAFTFEYNDGELVRITNAGNVGIGTSSPDHKLDISGSLCVDGFASPANNYITLRNTFSPSSAGGSGFKAVDLGSGNDDGLGVYGHQGMIFYSAQTERMRITSAGNVGIGTSSPAARLDVANSVDQTSLKVYASNATNSSAGIFFGAERNTTNDSFRVFSYYNYGASAYRFIVSDSGSIATAGSISLGATTFATSGIGVQFPATQSASSNANTLDDYEEGTFTPTLEYSGTNTPSYIVQTGRYTKIGRIVQIQILLGWNENGSTGNLLFTGLPFTSLNSNGRAAVTFLSFGLLIVTSSLTGYVNVNSTSIQPFINDNAATVVTATNTDNDQDVYMTVTYEVA